MASGFYSEEESYKTKLFITDIDTGITNIIYTDENQTNIHVHRDYIAVMITFSLYQYKIEESTTLRIIRLDKDGSNPILVMDENGEVVMKPIQ